MCPMPDGGRDPEDKSPMTPEDRSALTPEGGAKSGEGTLTPDDLDIEDDENVVSLDQGRYVIGTDERPNVPDEETSASPDSADSAGSAASADAAGATDAAVAEDPLPAAAADGSTVDSSAVKEWLEDDLQGTSARYGFHVSAKSEDAISHQQMFSDDVGTVFDSLLRWYAQQLTTETAVEDVLGILLTESNVRVRYSPSCFQAILEAYDLGPDDTIADLFEAVQDDHGIVFPPENV